MIKAIVTDIEGTTSSISFVKDELFPYARQHMAGFILQNHEKPNVAKQLDEVKNIVGNNELSIEQCIEQLNQWIDEDKKITPLKALQGMIWERGYKNGDFHGHIYPDAMAHLQKWYAETIDLYIFSSGSVHAQKLLFSHTAFGDLTTILSGYFDTNIGAKGEAESYKKISERIGVPANEIVFLSDVVTELDAAQQAGYHTYWLVRDGEIDKNAKHPQINNFKHIKLDE